MKIEMLGLHPCAVADPGLHYDRAEVLDHFALELEQDISQRVEANTITKIVLTHLHFDHAGGLALLPPSIPVVVQRREWAAGHDPAAIARNAYFPRDYVGERREIVVVDGDHDLLGDGSIGLLLTPGHTPGHQSVRVGDDLVLGRDVAYFDSGIDDHRFPMYGDDLAEQGRSAERLRELRDAGARVLPATIQTSCVPDRSEYRLASARPIAEPVCAYIRFSGPKKAPPRNPRRHREHHPIVDRASARPPQRDGERTQTARKPSCGSGTSGA